MTETRPKLEVVDGASVGAEAPAEAQDQARGRRTPWILGALLAAGLLLAAGGWIAQAREAARLERSLAASQAALAETRGELARAEGRLSAFEAHLGAARDRVAGLAREIGALGAFLAAGPDEGAAQP